MKKTIALLTLTAIIFISSCNNGDPEGLKKQFNLSSGTLKGSELTLYDSQGKVVASFEVISTYRVEESKPVAELKK